MRQRTRLLEAFLKNIQDVSDLDNFLKQFKEVHSFNTFEETEDGLSIYDSIPYDKAYIFPFAT